MSSSFSVPMLLNQDQPMEFISTNLTFPLETNEAKVLLKNILSILPEIDRFQDSDGLDEWVLLISLTEDEGVEFMIYHEELELIVLLLEDELLYSKEDIINNLGIDSFYIPAYHKFLEDPTNSTKLLRELRLWEIDSEFHTYAIDHVEQILNKGTDLPPFGGDPSTAVEFSFDEEEIFIGCTDDDSISTNPDYNLLHEDYDPSNPEESIELGIQSWTDFSDEDDDWDEGLDEDWDEEPDDYEWDSEVDEDWDPGFEEEDAQ